ncbi:MAG: DUF1802 family protein [Planctomycetaceae bacterium]|nr:DUF1802 family protein [Planctomycetaceae bacterium]
MTPRGPGLPAFAFKEWAAICRALAAGRQDVILRKGGIVEPGGAFRPEHAEFLLLPTFVHQAPESLVPDARDLLVDIDGDRPPEGSVVLRHMARVREALRIRSLADLAAFRGRHVWSDAVVAERFHRWQDELHVLEVEVTPLPGPLTLPWHDSYGGCKSWVELMTRG